MCSVYCALHAAADRRELLFVNVLSAFLRICKDPLLTEHDANNPSQKADRMRSQRRQVLTISEVLFSLNSVALLSLVLPFESQSGASQLVPVSCQTLPAGKGVGQPGLLDGGTIPPLRLTNQS